MIVYVLPGVGIYGGIKVGFRFVDALRALRIPAVVATPGGAAPRWFSSSAPVVAQESLLPALSGADTVLFSLPHDHERLRATGARMMFHCQGTDPLIDPVISDSAVTVLTCWEQARRYVHEKTGRASLDVGISVGDAFFGRYGSRVSGSITYMSRRGRTDVMAQMSLPAGTSVRAVDGEPECSVAEIMSATDVFVAVAENEWFGLPALEAMAAGCIVVSVPTVGGGFLRDGDNCIVVEPSLLGSRIQELLESPALGARLRRSGVVTAQAHRSSVQRDLLRHLLASQQLVFGP